MSRFKRIEVHQKIYEAPIIPVFYHEDLDISKEVLKACYKGGVRVFEFTNRGDFAHEIFRELNKWAAANCPELVLGIGSIVDPATASLYLQLGAGFVVGPLLNIEIFKPCNRRQVAYIPGCATITEVGLAQEMGAEFVKVFPGDVVGTSFVKSIKAPMPWTNIMVTGGVNPNADNLKKWFEAGASCLGMGSNLFPKEVIADRNWSKITELCEGAFDIVFALRR